MGTWSLNTPIDTNQDVTRCNHGIDIDEKHVSITGEGWLVWYVMGLKHSPNYFCHFIYACVPNLRLQVGPAHHITRTIGQ